MYAIRSYYVPRRGHWVRSPVMLPARPFPCVPDAVRRVGGVARGSSGLLRALPAGSAPVWVHEAHEVRAFLLAAVARAVRVLRGRRRGDCCVLRGGRLAAPHCAACAPVWFPVSYNFV